MPRIESVPPERRSVPPDTCRLRTRSWRSSDVTRMSPAMSSDKRARGFQLAFQEHLLNFAFLICVLGFWAHILILDLQFPNSHRSGHGRLDWRSGSCGSCFCLSRVHVSLMQVNNPDLTFTQMNENIKRDQSIRERLT